jgi:hypothetical protein
MRRINVGFIVLSALCVSARADLLWDNFITQPAGYDDVSGRSSERNSIITASWTGDDAVFNQPVALESLEWIGFRTPNVNFNAADVIILDNTFAQLALFENLPYTASIITTRTFNLETVEVYDGALQIPSTNLAAGHYYYAVRLFDAGLGRNYLATTGNGTLRGLGPGVFQSDQFGYPN